MKNDVFLKEHNPELYRVARERATEPAFSGDLLHNKEDGTYRCAVCDSELFSSDAKYDSGSGWPSFSELVSNDAVTLSTDNSHGMIRTEVSCASCGAHLGHVFDDGPGELGQRFCINSVSLSFDDTSNKKQNE